MKHLFFYIVCFWAFFNRGAAALEPPQLPDDFEGKLTREYVANYLEDDTYETTMMQNLNIYYEIGSYLYQKYPWEEITQKDFIEKLRTFFPYDTEDQLYKKHDYLVKTAALYQYGRDLYVKLANKFLVPHVYRKVHDESEFDHPREVKYIPAADDEYNKVYNFKKFLTYSANIDELNAISDFERNRKDNDDILTQIDRIVEKVDWKKVWLYGTTYKNPLFSDLGIGKTHYGDGANVRLLARSTYTEGKEILDFGVQIATNPRYFILANNLSADYTKPQIDFTGSENVENSEILYPLPQNTNVLPQVHKYFGNFIIPLKITPQNRELPVAVKTHINLTVCDFQMNCQPQSFNARLKSDVRGPDKFDNGFNTLFFNSLRRVPSDKQTELTTTQFNVVNTADGPQLFLETATAKKIKSFEAYIEDAEGYTQFAAPSYIIGDHTVQTYFKPFDAGETDLSKRSYTVSVNLNNRVFYRNTLTPNMTTTIQKQSISAPRKLLWRAFICGVTLNFMPCLAPFMLMLLVLLLRVSKKRPEVLRRRVFTAIYGSALGLLTATVLFTAQKYRVPDLIWGLQFNHTAVIICLLLGLGALLKLVPNVLTYATEIFVADNRAVFFICGGVTGVMFIFGAAPYLSQLMNIAVTLPILSTLLILLPLVLGFAALQTAVCYLLIRPQARLYAGNAQKEILIFIRYALYIALGFIWLYGAFICGFGYALLLMLLLVVWIFIGELYQKFLDYIDGALDETITPQQIEKIRRGSLVVMGVFLAAFLYGGMHLINHARAGKTLNPTSPTEVAQTVAERQSDPVLIIIGTDWCFKCQVNRLWTLNSLILQQWHERYGLQVVRVSQTAYAAQYMRENEQYALPFYILYTDRYPQGMVLNSEVEVENMELLLN